MRQEGTAESGNAVLQPMRPSRWWHHFLGRIPAGALTGGGWVAETLWAALPGEGAGGLETRRGV